MTEENKKWKEKLREIFFIQGKYKDQAIGLDDWEQFISQLLQEQKEKIIKNITKIFKKADKREDRVEINDIITLIKEL